MGRRAKGRGGEKERAKEREEGGEREREGARKGGKEKSRVDRQQEGRISFSPFTFLSSISLSLVLWCLLRRVLAKRDQLLSGSRGSGDHAGLREGLLSPSLPHSTQYLPGDSTHTHSHTHAYADTHMQTQLHTHTHNHTQIGRAHV